MSIFHFYLGISRYCVRCLSIASWQAGYDIHDFCCCHLRCWWSLFGEYCVRTSIVFYNITSEYNSKCIIAKCINSAKIATFEKKTICERSSNSNTATWTSLLLTCKWSLDPKSYAQSASESVVLELCLPLLLHALPQVSIDDYCPSSI